MLNNEELDKRKAEAHEMLTNGNWSMSLELVFIQAKLAYHYREALEQIKDGEFEMNTNWYLRDIAKEALEDK